MRQSTERQLVVAISSRALFDLSESHRIYQDEGLRAYSRHQIEYEESPLTPGVAFPLVTKLLHLNRLLEAKPGIEVILLSRNTADTGLRVLNSIRHHHLDISRAAFCGGEQPWRYVQAFQCDLFLSTETEDVQGALQQGVAAATLLPPHPKSDEAGRSLRFAFDGDAVIFSDASEQLFQREGLEHFAQCEAATAREPMDGGPFKGFLHSLQKLQAALAQRQLDSELRTALFTARSAPADERVIRTLRSWGIRVDEILFLGGRDKGAFLRAYGADVFFDDQQQHCASAQREQVTVGHVPHDSVGGAEHSQASKRSVEEETQPKSS